MWPFKKKPVGHINAPWPQPCPWCGSGHDSPSHPTIDIRRLRMAAKCWNCGGLYTTQPHNEIDTEASGLANSPGARS